MTHKVKKIPLTQNKFALVDSEDFDWLNQYKWCAHKIGNQWYVGTRLKGKYVLMHRLILNLNPGDKRHGDHIDHNGLNNKRYNLRICTHSQNLQNRYMQYNCSSGLKGAYKCTGSKTWMSRICANKRDIYLGTFKTKEQAAEAYQKAAKKYFGEFACIV